jgi:xylose isomerase
MSRATGSRCPEQQFAAASRIRGLEGVGLDYPYQFTEAEAVRPLLQKTGLEFVTLEIGLYPDRKWKDGTYTAPDPGVRREAIAMSRKALEVAAELGAVDVLMWPGQDGFDYPFQSDYQKFWQLLVDGIGEVGSPTRREDRHEYKKQSQGPIATSCRRGPARPAARRRTAERRLIDLVQPGWRESGEVLLERAGKLFQVHVDDNFRDRDHDLILGSGAGNPGFFTGRAAALVGVAHPGHLPVLPDGSRPARGSGADPVHRSGGE